MIPEYFAGVVATGAEVSIVAEPRQVVVDCRGCEICDRHLADIAREPDLTSLWLNNCSVTNSGVSKLIANERLEYLDVGSTHVDGSILRIVPSLPRLGGLGLTQIQRIALGIEFLLDHPTLSVIDFSFSDVTPSDLRIVLANSRVTNVDATGTRIEASDLTDLDDIDAEPYRTVIIRLSDLETMAIVMGFKNGERELVQRGGKGGGSLFRDEGPP